MDLEIFGFKLSKFITAFKKSYKLSDDKYDYMAYLKDTDCASYCGMLAEYKNPNEVLNYFITPSLKNIDVVGGRKKKMKGGAPTGYIFILMLFLLMLSNIFSGPAYDELVREFGENPTNWPKETGPEPSYPPNRWNGFIITIGPTAENLRLYKEAFTNWMGDTQRYNKFLVMQEKYAVEYESSQQLEKEKTAVQQTLANAEYSKTVTAETEAMTLNYAFVKLNELSEKNSQYKEEIGFWKGIALGGGSMLGIILFLVGYFYTKVMSRGALAYDDMLIENGPQQQQVPLRIGDAKPKYLGRRQLANEPAFYKGPEGYYVSGPRGVVEKNQYDGNTYGGRTRNYNRRIARKMRITRKRY